MDDSPSRETDADVDISTEGTRLETAVSEFVLLWGDMASSWGINRTMAQIHALLYASEEPLDTDSIMERLHISRGNANMNLRALLDWRLVRRSNQAGSRKDFYQAEKDVWTITTTIIEERQRREIAPVKSALRRVSAGLNTGTSQTDAEAQLAERLEALVSFVSVFEGFTKALRPLLSSRSARHVQRIIQFASTLKSAPQNETDNGDLH